MLATSSTRSPIGSSSSLTELQERLPVNEKARAEQGVAEARQAIADEVAIDRLRQLISDLQQLVAALPSRRSAPRRRGDEQQRRRERRAAAPSEDEEVVDAEFTRE